MTTGLNLNTLRFDGIGPSSKRLLVLHPLMVLWLGYLLLSLACWLRWGSTGWAMGSYWWDELALSSAAHAVNEGLTPARDFWAPFVLPLYIKAWAYRLAGNPGGYLVECLLQGGLVLSLYSLLVRSRPMPLAMHALAAWAVLLAVLPFNIESVVEAKAGYVVYAGVYNRLGGSLMMLGMLWVEVSRLQRHDRLAMLWLSLLFSICLLVKVTAWQVVLTSLWLHAMVRADKVALRALLVSTVLSMALTLSLLWVSGQLEGYVHALLDMGQVRSELMRARWQVSRDVLADQRLVLFLNVLIVALVVLRGLLLRVCWWPSAVWCLLTLGLVTFYMLSNFGDNGLAPMAAALWVLLADVRRSSSLDPSGRSASISAMLFGGARVLWVGYLALYLAFQGHRLHALWWHESTVAIVHAPFQNQHLRESVRMDAETWRTRSPLHVPGTSLRVAEPAAHAGYAAAVDDAAKHLAAAYPSRSTSVYVLDYPALMFSLLEGYRVPRGVLPWMIFGHELSILHHPPAQVLMRDVDVLILSKCSLSSGNRRYLHRIYRAEIERHWVVKTELTCWVVHERKSIR